MNEGRFSFRSGDCVSPKKTTVGIFSNTAAVAAWRFPACSNLQQRRFLEIVDRACRDSGLDRVPVDADSITPWWWVAAFCRSSCRLL
jgi:hypothetical protein